MLNEKMNIKHTQETYQNFQNLRGMRGLAAAVIRQAFEDADKTYAPLITSVIKRVKVESRQLFGEIDKDGKIFSKPTKEQQFGKKKAKPRLLGKIVGNKIYKPTTYKTIEYDIKEIEDSKQKLVYQIVDCKGRIFGYIERNKIYQATFRYKPENKKELDFDIIEKEKPKTANTSTLTKFEINSARSFILGETKEWRDSLNYFCDLADLDPLYIIKLAKQRSWYKEYMNESRLKGEIICQLEKRPMKLKR